MKKQLRKGAQYLAHDLKEGYLLALLESDGTWHSQRGLSCDVMQELIQFQQSLSTKEEGK